MNFALSCSFIETISFIIFRQNEKLSFRIAFISVFYGKTNTCIDIWDNNIIAYILPKNFHNMKI